MWTWMCTWPWTKTWGQNTTPPSPCPPIRTPSPSQHNQPNPTLQHQKKQVLLKTEDQALHQNNHIMPAHVFGTHAQSNTVTQTHAHTQKNVMPHPHNKMGPKLRNTFKPCKRKKIDKIKSHNIRNFFSNNDKMREGVISDNFI